MARLDESAPAGTSVLILGRYRRTRELIRGVLGHRWKHLTVEFRTIHAAKGAEADHVILPGIVAGGLPSMVADDPLLDLSKPTAEGFPHAEERRVSTSPSRAPDAVFSS